MPTPSPTVGIEVHRVPAEVRPGTLSRHFGQRMLTVEHKVYQFMREIVPGYRAGSWHFYELTNGGFYMAPEAQFFHLSVKRNHFEGRMSADAAGITACLFAFGYLSFQFPKDEVFGVYLDRLWEFAQGHAEADPIFAAID